MVAPGSGHWLVGRERRAIGFFAAIVAATLVVPWAGPVALFAGVLLRLASAIELFFGRIDVPSPARALRGTLAILALGILFVVLIRTRYTEGYRVPGSGMAPTLVPGDLILARKFGASARPGDVIVHAATEPDTGTYVQRVVAGAGEVVAVRAGRLFVNGTPVTGTSGSACALTGELGGGSATCFDERLGDHRYTVAIGGENDFSDFPGVIGCRPGMEAVDGGCRVPDGHLFVLGDDRSHSRDSRHFGPVATDRIEGVVLFVWYGRDGMRWQRNLDR